MIMAFYKKDTHHVSDRIIRQWQKIKKDKYWKYSHVEVILPDGTFFSSSPRDGGVRKKYIQYDDNVWDFYRIGVTMNDAVVSNESGKKYDWLGIALSQVVPFAIQSENKWFCSEISGHMIGVYEPYKFSPSRLAEHVITVLGAKKVVAKEISIFAV